MEWSLRDYGIPSSVWGGVAECEHEFEIQNKEINPKPSSKSTLGYCSNGEYRFGKEGSPYLNNLNKSEIKSGFCSKCNAWFGCLGLEPTFELYVQHLADIFDLLKPKLKKSGTVWVNLGDSYDNKQLLMIPQRFAIEMVSRGWILRNVIIWHKSNCMPSSARDRFTVDFEYVYFFVKSKRYWFDQDAVREPSYAIPYSQNSLKGGVQEKNNPRINYKKGQELNGRNKRCVWEVPTKPNSAAHFATFNSDLITPMIKAGCPPKGIVLDPFAGTGTTCLTAWELGRDYLGIEINPEYVKDIAMKVLEKTKNKRVDEWV